MKLAAAIALALGLPVAAHAAPVLFSPQGNGTVIDASGMDWSVTSAVAVGGTSAIAQSIANGGGAGGTFTLLTHARLVATTAENGDDTTPGGLNGPSRTFEITITAAFQECVTSVDTSTGTAHFATTGTGLLQMFYDPSHNSDPLTGHGYNDGTLILQGDLVPTGVQGQFQVTNSTPVRLDQFPTNSPGSDNYTGQQTVSGSGSNDPIPVDHLTQDSAFFVSQLATFGIRFANISQSLPFTSQQPSDCFTNKPSTTGGADTPVGGTTSGAQQCALFHVNGTYAANSPDANGGYVPVTGAVNGLFGSGPDFTFQTDFNSSLSRVPEPGTLALLGLGLGVVGWTIRRSKSA
jgi:hypothetical protein